MPRIAINGRDYDVSEVQLQSLGLKQAELDEKGMLVEPRRTGHLTEYKAAETTLIEVKHGSVSLKPGFCRAPYQKAETLERLDVAE